MPHAPQDVYGAFALTKRQLDSKNREGHERRLRPETESRLRAEVAGKWHKDQFTNVCQLVGKIVTEEAPDTDAPVAWTENKLREWNMDEIHILAIEPAQHAMKCMLKARHFVKTDTYTKYAMWIVYDRSFDQHIYKSDMRKFGLTPETNAARLLECGGMCNM